MHLSGTHSSKSSPASGANTRLTPAGDKQGANGAASGSQLALPGSSPSTQADHWRLVGRLLQLSWRYRWGCVGLLGMQFVLLWLAILGVQLTGSGIDLVRHHLDPQVARPQLLWGWDLPADWSPYAQVMAVAGGVAGLAVARSLLNYFYAVQAGLLVHERIVVDLRSAVYAKLQQLSFRFYDANASGSIINRVTSDVQAVRAFIDSVLLQLAVLVMSLAIYIGCMFRLHVGLTLACLATTPLMWVITTIFSRIVRPMYDENRHFVDRLILTLAENAQGVQVVKGFGLEDAEIAKFDRANHRVRDQQQGIFWRVSLFSPAVQFLTQVNLAVLLAYGGYLVAIDQFSLGTGLVVFAGLLQQFSSQVGNLTALANSVQQSLSGARRVFEVLDAPLEVQNVAQPLSVGRVTGAIELRDVSFAYRGHDAVLRHIDLRIEPGERWGILGATGSGKTTLLSLVARFFDPQAGEILLDGRDVRQLDLEALRRSMGIVFQESFLFSNSIAANIAFGSPYACPAEIHRAARWAAAAEFIEALPDGYDTVLGEFGMSLSGGQRQRLAIARALLPDPPILLLDDPTAAVDATTERAILATLQEAAQGRTTLLVSNRISALATMDRIAVLEAGQITQIGTHEELLKERGWYRDVALSQGILEQPLATPSSEVALQRSERMRQRVDAA